MAASGHIPGVAGAARKSGLALHIYTVKEVERVVCNGQDMTPRRVSAYHYAAKLKLQDGADIAG